MKHIVWKLVLPALFFIAGPSCKPKKQEIPPFGDVYLRVQDENNQPVDSAVVYLYNSQAAFDFATQNAKKGVYTSIGSIATGSFINGQIVFQELASNSNYWVLAHDASGFFMDNAISTNIINYRDNSEAYFFVPSFQNGTKVTANIRLVPAYALIKFLMTSNSDVITKIKIGDSDSSGSILSGTYLKVRKGTLPYYLYSNSCVWSGEIQAEGGKVVVENLGSCAFVNFNFQTAATNFQSPIEYIKIYIGQNRYDASQPPFAILTPNQLSQMVVLANDGAAYTYFAVHSNGKCVWEGPVESLVTLNTCY